MRGPSLIPSTRFELLSTFRDRHTLIYTVLVPLFLYPALFFGIVQLVQVTESMAPQDIRIGVWGQGPIAEALKADSTIDLLDITEFPELLDSNAVARALDSLYIDAALFVEGLSARLVYLSSRSRSVSAMESVERTVTRIREDSLASISGSLGGSWVSVFEMRTYDIAEPEAGGRMLLSLIIPLTLVVMTTLGAYYPAVDIAAGEKERRTVETTLSQPRRPVELVLAKLATVTLSAALSLFLNLMSMFLAARLIIPPDMEGMTFGIEPLQLVLLMITGLIFALLASSVLLLMAFRARSFREAQSTVGAVYGLGILPAIVAIVPGISLDNGLALIPVANTALVIKALLRGALEPLPFIIYVASTIALTAVALHFCTRSIGDPERWLVDRKRRGFLSRILSSSERRART